MSTKVHSPGDNIRGHARLESVEVENTPPSSRWKTQLLFDSDEEYSNFYQSETPTLDKDTALRTRLFEDEESRDSGVGMGNDIEEVDNLDLPVRSFPLFTENGRCENLLFPVFQQEVSEAYAFTKETPSDPDSTIVKESKENHEVGVCEKEKRKQCLRLKRERPTYSDVCSPARKRRVCSGRFRRHKSLDTSCKQQPLRETSSMLRPSYLTNSDSGSDDEARTGDNCRRLCLPTVDGKHRDLHSITPETLSRVINLEYSETIEKAVIVDCRYPYEYTGGHIKGAINCFTKDGVLELFMAKHSRPNENSGKRFVLIFHCEFSSERAPKLSRFLRKMDRDANKECYPKLFYPEMYLLDGGYKNFFRSQKDMCTPPSYVPMHDAGHKEDMRKFRTKSKSWSGDKKSRSVFGF
ncbi:M-phase inducer phosphatase 1-B-like [Liolophura sinensis]|uniref:M-phase inducer phosphatase 1-B-like n=1 Tax=Liolophura sinensis TaxID=3198878 RepID=UPI0031590970